MDVEAPSPAGYVERLWVPWSWWLLGATGGALLVDELDTTLLIGQVWTGWRVVSIAFCTLFYVTMLLNFSLTRVRVVDGQLDAAGQRLAVDRIGELRPVNAEVRRRLMGPQGNRLANLVTRPWVKPALLIEVVDPADRTPYWLVSSRHPDRLAAALAAAKVAAAPAPLDRSAG